MFIGIPPQSQKRFYLHPFEPHQFLVIALETARKLEWQIEKIQENGFVATVIKSGKAVSEIHLNVTGNEAVLTSCSINGIIDLRNSKNIRQFANELIDMKYDLKPDQINQLWENLKNEFQKEASSGAEISDTNRTIETADEKDNQSGFALVFLPRKGYLVAPVLIYVNILLFLIQALTGVGIMNPEIEDLIKWGGNLRSLTLGGQWWRLLTNCFLHIGVMHVLMNMYALLYVGLLLEPLIGSGRFAYAYFLSGIFASITSVLWHNNMVSAGASGAIFGMYGVFVALLFTNLISKDVKKDQLTSMIIFIVYNLAYGLKGGIDNAAHLGGLGSGLLIGFTYYGFLKAPDLRTRNFIIHGSALLGLMVLSGFFLSRTDDAVGDYTKIMITFDTHEKKALGMYLLPENTTDREMLHEIETNGIPNWIKCRHLIDSASRIEKLPPELSERNSLLKRYVDYRIRCYNIIRNSIREQTYTYRSVIDQYNQKIELIIKKLNGENIPDSELVYNYDPLSFLPRSSLYIVDGKVVDNIDQLDRKDIKDAYFLNADAAVSLYGERAGNGALIINTWEFASEQEIQR